MLAKRTIIAETLRTIWTLEGLLPRVCSPMNSQLKVLEKLLVAKLTLEPLAFGVQSHVRLQCRLTFVGFILAYRTVELAPFVDAFHVVPESLSAAEPFATFLTDALIRVSRLVCVETLH